jgi:CheY-like chemotaxis protein
MQNGIEQLPLRTKSVLIADDDREMRRLLSTCFQRVGFDVVEARDGRELVVTFRRMRRARVPHVVVVTDIDMPNMTGLEALRQIRRGMPDAHVIVVTALGDDSIRRYARRLGAAAVFEKPVDVELLCDTALLLAGN